MYLASLIEIGVRFTCTFLLVRTMGRNLQFSMPFTGLIMRRKSFVFALSGMLDCEGAWCF